MADKTGISWTSATWNPVTGCAKVTQGCKHCYAERDWARLAHLPAYEGRAFTDVACHPERLDQPLRWSKPRMIFVNSMSDLFHEDVPDEFIDQVFAVMALAQDHTFQVLTKRPARMLAYLTERAAGGRHIWCAGQQIKMPGGREKPAPGWPLPNVWLGVSVENQAAADERIPLLLQTPAAVRWVSCEPLLGPVDLREVVMPDQDTLGTYLHNDGEQAGLDWVVVGGESGPKARPMHPDWARRLRDQCEDARVPFFFKQTGAWQQLPAGEDSSSILPKDLWYVSELDCTFRRTKGGGDDRLDGREYKAWPHSEE